MKDNDATEIAYKNGYEKAKQDILNKINAKVTEIRKKRRNEYSYYVLAHYDGAISELEKLKDEIEGMR